MNDGKFQDWYNFNFDDNAVAYAEKNEEEFEDFCFNRYIQKGDE